MRLLLLFSLALTAGAQLIPTGSPIPKGPNPPVIFLNGYETTCPSPFPGYFGIFDQIMQRNNRVSLYFDNCAYTNKPPIEDLGDDFAAFLAALKYTDGTSVTQVDVVGHSLGGLIVRSYLAGKKSAGGFQPPATVPIRKAVFLATPHFGSANPAIFLVGDAQVTELSAGSQFTFDLATWNQGTDDLRGVDSLAIAGTGGTGLDTMPGFDDGVVSLTSASIGFAIPNRTRIINACHTDNILITLFGYCSSSAPPIAAPKADTDPVAAITTSFLAGTTAWQTIGQAAEQNSLLIAGAGLYVREKSAADAFVPLDSAKVTKSLNLNGTAVAYTEYVTPLAQPLTATSGTTIVQQNLMLNPGTVNTIIAKNGPQITRILPSASVVFPLTLAPASYASIYGSNFSPDSIVTAGGMPAQIIAMASTQINVILPTSLSGFVPVTVTNAGGQSTANVLMTSFVPTLFTQDGSGTGSASALNAVTNALITPSNPLHSSDYVSLYLTGISAVVPGIPVSITVTVAGQACAVTYAGAAPGYTALDQINCQIPTGIAPTSSAPVIVTAAGHVSNTATLAIQ